MQCRYIGVLWRVHLLHAGILLTLRVLSLQQLVGPAQIRHPRRFETFPSSARRGGTLLLLRPCLPGITVVLDKLRHQPVARWIFAKLMGVAGSLHFRRLSKLHILPSLASRSFSGASLASTPVPYCSPKVSVIGIFFTALLRTVWVDGGRGSSLLTLGSCFRDPGGGLSEL